MAVIEYDAQGKPHNESGKRIATTISVTQLFRLFPDEAACVEWFEDARWDGRPTCPHCGSQDDITTPKSKPGYYWCKACRKQFNVKTDTMLHATKRPLQDWIYAIYSVLTARKGVSAMQLSKELGVQYRTAWHMLHRIREACDRGDFKLEKVVEVDETYIGGLEGNKHESKKLHAGTGGVGKTPVVGAKQRDGKVKAKPIEKANKATLIPFVEENVKEGSTVYTDEASSYRTLATPFNRFHHDTVAHGRGEYVRGDVHTNGIEAVWAVLKRSIHGTWHHVSPKHLARYINEASFRLNEGNCEVDTLDRMKAFASGIYGKRLSWKALIAKNGKSAIPKSA